ncbi:unnamed protein product [Boreogadus saida]
MQNVIAYCTTVMLLNTQDITCFPNNQSSPASDTDNFFQIISNLLEEENKEKWEDAQQSDTESLVTEEVDTAFEGDTGLDREPVEMDDSGVALCGGWWIYPGAVELMQVIEEFIHIVGLGMKDFHNAYLMTGNLVASIQRLPAVSVMTDINFPMKGRKGMVDWARNSEDKVVIPKGLFVSPSAGDMDGSPVFILGTVLYKTLGLMLPSPKNHTVVNSKIIAVTVRPEPRVTSAHLEIELAHLANVQSIRVSPAEPPAETLHTPESHFLTHLQCQLLPFTADEHRNTAPSV